VVLSVVITMGRTSPSVAARTRCPMAAKAFVSAARRRPWEISRRKSGVRNWANSEVG
jgi:hypothetical protein